MNSTIVQEMSLAGRGLIAVLFGKSDASDYFDLTLRGLATSMIAFLLAATFNAFFPGVLTEGANAAGEAQVPPSAASAMVLVSLLFVLQTAFGAMALQQFGKISGLVPYLVVSNWANFFFTAFFTLLRMFDISAEVFLVLMATILIVSEVNILRLITKLKFMQIAMFLVAQLVGTLSALMVFEVINPG